MLLRLLPAPSASQPSPPTILFTLPLPVNAYTAKSLPLPPNLLSHRSLCLQEGIECSNVLLGDQATWISGVVDDVTFSMQTGQITAHLIDGSTIALPIDPSCVEILRAVINQVQLSFALPSSQTPRRNVAGPAGPANTGKRNPSGLLYSLLSPLLSPPAAASSSSSVMFNPQHASRFHRRQARSLLVDAYQRYVLPALKEVLPKGYLQWTIQSEVAAKQVEWEKKRMDLDLLMERAGCAHLNKGAYKSQGSSYGLSRRSSPYGSASSLNDSDDSSDDESLLPTTPATSIWNHSSLPSMTPLAQLALLPPANSIPDNHRQMYTALIAQLTTIGSRLANLKKLSVRMEREEGRKNWLMSLESSRHLERSSRRAWSNMSGRPIQLDQRSAFRPMKSSSLWKSYTYGEEEETYSHPAMEDAMATEDVYTDEEEIDPFAADIVVRPLSPPIFAAVEAVPALVASRSDDSIVSTVAVEVHSASKANMADIRPKRGGEKIFEVREEDLDYEAEDDEPLSFKVPRRPSIEPIQPKKTATGAADTWTREIASQVLIVQ